MTLHIIIFILKISKNSSCFPRSFSSKISSETQILIFLRIFKDFQSHEHFYMTITFYYFNLSHSLNTSQLQPFSTQSSKNSAQIPTQSSPLFSVNLLPTTIPFHDLRFNSGNAETLSLRNHQQSHMT